MRLKGRKVSVVIGVFRMETGSYEPRSKVTSTSSEQSRPTISKLGPQSYKRKEPGPAPT